MEGGGRIEEGGFISDGAFLVGVNFIVVVVESVVKDRGASRLAAGSFSSSSSKASKVESAETSVSSSRGHCIYGIRNGDEVGNGDVKY